MSAVNPRSNLQTDPIRNFRYVVQFMAHDETTQKFGFLPTLGFTSVSGLSVNTEAIPYREGGYNTTVHQIPGQTQFGPITLQRGVLLGTMQNWNWMQRMFSITGNSLPGGDFRADMYLFVLAHPSSNTASSEITAGSASTPAQVGTVLDDKVHMKFHVYNVWPTTVAYSDMNAGDNALLVEQMTIVHEGFNCIIADKFISDVHHAAV